MRGKPIAQCISRTQHRRVDALLGKYTAEGQNTEEMARSLDNASMTEQEQDTWQWLRRRWVLFGYIGLEVYK